MQNEQKKNQQQIKLVMLYGEFTKETLVDISNL